MALRCGIEVREPAQSLGRILAGERTASRGADAPEQRGADEILASCVVEDGDAQLQE